MKGGKKKNGAGSAAAPDAVRLPLPPSVADGGEVREADLRGAYAVAEVREADFDAAAARTVAEDQKQQEEERQMEGGVRGGGGEEGDAEEEEDGEGEKGYNKFEHLEIEEGEAEPERPKLAEGFYEIEAVRKKRIRKGEAQYLIKWRGWPESDNTWEPLENLMSCSDVIEAFEERLRSGKQRSSRGRKRKNGVTHTQSKKKQQTSPAATYDVPAVKVRIIEEPLLMASLDDLSLANGVKMGVNDVESSRQVKENGFGLAAIRVGEKEHNELNLRLSELRGAKVTREENATNSAIQCQQANASEDGPANELSKVDSVEQGKPGPRTGSRRRKSGSVKRFKQDSSRCVLDDAQNVMPRASSGPCGRVGWKGGQNLDFVGNNSDHKNKFENSKNVPTITEILRPLSYSSSDIKNIHDVVVTFTVMRSDGREVMVDNKFLKAHYPLLLINFYEQHLRYSPAQ